MIRGSKSMIADCIGKVREGMCAGCDREAACASLFRRFGLDSRWTRRVAPAARAQPAPGAAFATIFREIARTLEARMAPAAPPALSPFRKEAEKQLEALLPGGAVRMEALAHALGCSRQTLYRRLRAEGTTFEALLDGVRRRLASSLLRDERISVKEVAYRLGFADPAAFSRAFKRWTGRSPRAWRDGRVRPPRRDS
jgi:AraC-like DNA-binding protein